jgi:hypothetical protein
MPSAAYDLSPELQAYIPRFIQIESGGDPNARTGSYSGLLQMGPDEIAKYGGNGLEQGTQLLRDRAQQLTTTLGREPTPTELYLAHQQGMGGVQAHISNPDAPAWQNMASTAEGRRKGEGWAKQAIWGNVPDSIKAQYPGGVDSLTSRQFMDLWRSKVERTPLSVPQSSAIATAGLLDAPQSQAHGLLPELEQSTPAQAAQSSGLLGGMQQQQQPDSFAMPDPMQPQMMRRKPIDLSRLQAMLKQPARRASWG